jgi:hypothetical protein
VRGGEADEHRLALLRLEPGRDQALRQVLRQIVPACLPLEPLAARREEVALPRDKGIQRVTGEPAQIPVLQEAAVGGAADAPHRAVPLGRAVVGNGLVAGTQL